jgi:PIN domain
MPIDDGEHVLLVDYENVSKVDLGAIPAGVRVPFFFGAAQKKVSTEFLRDALKLAPLFELINIEGQGKNALDFHIAFYLGEYLARNRNTQCVILSKDTGFDPLISHLKKRGFNVRRTATLGGAFPSRESPARKASTTGAAAEEVWQRASTWLDGLQRNRRPRKRRGLVASLYSHLSKKVPEAQIEQFVDRMIAEGRISESNGALSYNLSARN